MSPKDENPDTLDTSQEEMPEVESVVDESPENQKSPDGPNRKKQRIVAVVLIAAAVTAIIGFGLWRIIPGTVQSALPEGAASEERNVGDSVAVVDRAVSSGNQMRQKEIDFAGLKEKNADIIAWIALPGTVIDYPVVCTNDNSFYLYHNEFRERSASGAVFIDMSNEQDFSSPLTVAYGHYMPDDTYFTQLHRYKNEDYFADNRELFIYLPDKILKYEIMAAYLTGNENVLYEKDYSDEKTMRDFMDALPNEQDVVMAEETMDTQDQLLILSTCTQYAMGDDRYLVVARLCDEYQYT